MKKSLYILLLLFFFHNSIFAAFDITRLSSSTGFFYDAIYTICKDDRGVVWIGNNNGLYIYDGKNSTHCKNYGVKGDIINSSIYNIFKDSRGILWISSNKGVAFFDNINNRYISLYNKRFEGKNIYSVDEINKNRYLILVGNDIVEYDRSNHKAIFISNNCKYNFSTQLKIDSENFYLGGMNGDVFLLSIKNGYNITKIYSGVKDKIISICQVNDKIYVGYEHSGIDIIWRNGDFSEHISTESSNERIKISSNNIRKIITRKDSEIWIATFRGLSITKGNKSYIYNKSNSLLTSNSIYSLYKDNDDNIWIGTWSGGLCCYNPYEHRFKSVVSDKNNNEIGVIPAFAQCDNSHLWIGGEDFGLKLYDYKNDKFIENREIKLSHIKSLLNYRGNLWIGTIKDGLYCVKENDNKPISISLDYYKKKKNQLIISSLDASDNDIWISTRDAIIIKYNYFEKKEVVYKLGSNDFDNRIWQIYIDKKNNVYACTDKGLYVKSNVDNEFKQIKNVYNNLYCICELENGLFLLGSKNNGILKFDSKAGTLNPVKNNSLFISKEIYSIKQFNNKLWISSNDGILKYDRSNNRLTSYDRNDGLIGKQFHPLAAFITNDGYGFWGSTNGFNYMKIKDLKVAPLQHMPVLTHIEINNKKINFSNVEADSKYIPNINKLRMDYNQNTLSFKFAADNSLMYKMNKLRYKLIGYSDEWYECMQDNNIIFTQIPPGKYVLRVIGSNNEGEWGKNYKEIEIIIDSPLYMRWYAYIFYFIIFSLIAFYFIRDYYMRDKLKKKISFEQYKNKIDKDMINEKTKFFLNISHELKTPINLILAPLNEMQEMKHDNNMDFYITTIKRNAERLCQLTDQILDFRLLEINKHKLDLKKTDVVAICKDVIADFKFVIKNKNIEMLFNSESYQMYAFADKSMITKIISNLISNAIKYSPDKISISLNISKVILTDKSYNNTFYVGNNFTGSALEISVNDQGAGISSEEFNSIFERFYTIHKNNQNGCGIGLHLCKEFIMMNSGNIMLTSTIGEGSCFTMHLPTTYIENDIHLSTNNKSNVVFNDDSSKEDEVSIVVNDTDEKTNNLSETLLIVDDNDEAVFYLKKRLSLKYRCLRVNNGENAIKLCKEMKPDIIIMDLFMPGIDGIECTRIMRNDMDSKSIPIIILSCASDNENKRQCIEAGADLFLSRPVDEKLLESYIEQFIRKKDIIRSNKKDTVIVPVEFMERLNLLIDERISEYDLNIDMIAEEMNMSRSTLFRKVKAETNESLSIYLRNQRLSKSISLMKLGQKSVEEIASASGFSSSSYYCNCFKNKYKMTPKEFIQRNVF